jgi:hypothetical protein
MVIHEGKNGRFPRLNPGSEVQRRSHSFHLKAEEKWGPGFLHSGAHEFAGTIPLKG